MTEILSQDEIDALLSAISGGETDGQAPEHERIHVHDFRRPPRLTPARVEAVRLIHEAFATKSTRTLTSLLRCSVGVHVGSVDELLYEEFIRSIPNPTTLGLVELDPLPGLMIIEIDPSLSFTMLDRLLGGPGEPSKITRELSAVEEAILESVLVRILSCLREAWSGLADLRPRLHRVETNPQLAQVLPAGAPVCLVTLETSLGLVEGMVNLCMPVELLDGATQALVRPEGITRPLPAELDARQQQPLRFEKSASFQLGPIDWLSLSAMKAGATIPLVSDVGRTLYAVEDTFGPVGGQP